MQTSFYSALTSSLAYSAVVAKTFREYAGNTDLESYSVYYEISDLRDADLEGVGKTGKTRIQLDVFSLNATTSKKGCDLAIEAIQESGITLISSTSRSKGINPKTRRYCHSTDLLIHY